MLRNGWIGLLLMLVFRVELYAQTEVLFSHQGGFYQESFPLSLACSDLNAQIRYTTNGNMPTADSKLYEWPLLLDENLYSRSDIFKLQVSPESLVYVPDSVRHAIVIRTAAFDEEGRRMGPVATNTYLIGALGADSHGLAVMSICADSLALFDYDTGIMVPGVNQEASDPEGTGNYFQHGREWERLANVEFYEPTDNSGINQQCGLRTHGRRARAYPQKGLKIYAREEYGKKRFKHRFFDTTPITSFKHLVIKPYSTLWPFSGVQDYVANRMAMELGLEAPNSRPVAVYLNGEYWGIYFLQEKLDDRYLEDHFDIDPEQCNILSGNGIHGYTGDWNIEVESGEGADFEHLLGWLEDADLSDSANYVYLNSLIDVDNFIDYQILELFIANTDWPANNFRCWQTADSEWRFAFFDGDASLLDTTCNVFERATYVAENQWHTGGRSTLIFRRLLENDDFKLRFKQRVDTLCNTIMRYDNTALYLDEVQQAMVGEVPNMIARFGYPESINYWYWGCFLARDFLCNRVAAFLKQCDSFEPLKVHHYESNTDDFVIFPNPTEDEVNIMMLDGRSRKVDFVLCDVMGRCMINGTRYLHACEPVVLGSELRSGVYVVKIGPYSHKFVKF